MKDLKQMQREGREGLKKFEQHESDGYNQALTDILENVVKPLYRKE